MEAACSQCAASSFLQTRCRAELPLGSSTRSRCCTPAAMWRLVFDHLERSNVKETHKKRPNLPWVDGRMTDQSTLTWTAVALVISSWRQGRACCRGQVVILFSLPPVPSPRLPISGPTTIFRACVQGSSYFVSPFICPYNQSLLFTAIFNIKILILYRWQVHQKHLFDLNK